MEMQIFSKTVETKSFLYTCIFPTKFWLYNVLFITTICREQNYPLTHNVNAAAMLANNEHFAVQCNLKYLQCRRSDDVGRRTPCPLKPNIVLATQFTFRTNFSLNFILRWSKQLPVNLNSMQAPLELYFRIRFAISQF